MEKWVPPHPFPCLFCGVSGLPGNQEPEVPPPRVPIACEDEINSIENRWTQSPFPSFTASSINLIACCQPASSNSNQSGKGFRRSPYLQSYTHSEVLPFHRRMLRNVLHQPRIRLPPIPVLLLPNHRKPKGQFPNLHCRPQR